MATAPAVILNYFAVKKFIKEDAQMEKKLNKPYSRNVRLDKPCGLIGVPPDTTSPVMIVARMTEAQYTAILDILLAVPQFSLTQ